MTPGEFKAAVMHLAVPYDRENPDPMRKVKAHPLGGLYLAAAGAFTRAGALAWLRFMKRRDRPNENAACVEFLAWLKRANEEEISGFIKAAERQRKAVISAGRNLEECVLRDRAAHGEVAPENERGLVLKGAEGRLLWQETLEKITQRSAAGVGSGKARGEARKSKVLDEAKTLLIAHRREIPSRWNAAGTIAARLNDKPNQKQADRILGKLAVDGANGLPAEWRPHKDRSP